MSWYWMIDWQRQSSCGMCQAASEHSSEGSELRNRNFHYRTAVCYICHLCSNVTRWIGNTTTLMTSARTFLEPGNTPVCRDCSIHAGGRTWKSGRERGRWRTFRTALAFIMVKKWMLFPDRKNVRGFSTCDPFHLLGLILSRWHHWIYVFGGEVASVKSIILLSSF